MDSIVSYQSAVLKIKQNSINEANSVLEKENSKKNMKRGEVFNILGAYLKKVTWSKKNKNKFKANMADGGDRIK